LKPREENSTKRIRLAVLSRNGPAYVRTSGDRESPRSECRYSNLFSEALSWEKGASFILFPNP